MLPLPPEAQGADREPTLSVPLAPHGSLTIYNHQKSEASKEQSPAVQFHTAGDRG